MIQKEIIAMTMIGFLGISSSCTTVSRSSPNPQKELQRARQYAKEGEYYRARKTAEGILRKHPAHPEAKAFIAEIIDREVAQHKELFENRVPEEFSTDEKSVEIQTWLERSRSLLQIGEYDEALESAEKVFSYDPDNLEASRLIDEIRHTALKDGKAEALVRNKIAREESQSRVGGYLEQARKAFQAGQIGIARLALDKVLLLQPENEEALKLRHQIEQKRKIA